jgi:hypothetical protein
MTKYRGGFSSVLYVQCILIQSYESNIKFMVRCCLCSTSSTFVKNCIWDVACIMCISYNNGPFNLFECFKFLFLKTESSKFISIVAISIIFQLFEIMHKQKLRVFANSCVLYTETWTNRVMLIYCDVNALLTLVIVSNKILNHCSLLYCIYS